MVMKLIKTPEEHSAAIERLSKLIENDPPPGTREADDLELLAHLIERYENAQGGRFALIDESSPRLERTAHLAAAISLTDRTGH
jgi:antitoxin component HigA of HigAB toxin-antitoxin module